MATRTLPGLRHFTLLFLFALALRPVPLRSQGRQSALSDTEVEKLRDSAYDSPRRVQFFIDFLEERAKAIDKLNSGRRHAGREEDIHDLMEQFTLIVDELDDNLDDYRRRHQDMRKVLPKLVSATERWATSIKSPPDNEAYNVSRKLALEEIVDLRETARKDLEEQTAYFLAHPPDKPEDGKRKPE